MSRTPFIKALYLFLLPIIAIVYVVLYLLAFNDPLMVLVPIMIGIAPGYMLSKIIDLKKFDLIEYFAIIVLISAAIGGTIYAVFRFVFDVHDLQTTGMACSIIVLILSIIPLVMRSDDQPHSREGGLSISRKKLSRLQKIIAVVCVAVMISATLGSSYLLMNKETTGFTEYYILSDGGSAKDIPRNYSVGQGQKIIMGIVNHEQNKVNYTVEVWLVNFTLINMAVNVTEMYFYDRFNLTLESVDVEIEGPWQPQWESYFDLNFSVSGDFYLYFMMFKNTAEELPEPYPMDPVKDYSKTTASWRVVLCVNNSIQYLRMPISISD